MPRSAIFCPSCGAIVPSAASAPAAKGPPAWVIALFVAAPLGALGSWLLGLDVWVGATVGAVCGAIGVAVAGKKKS